jgi:single-strand DNA-binding protein
MPDLNKVFLAGRLTRDPELRYTPSGAPVCKMGLAADRRYRTKDGEQREETLFINVTAWSRTAEFCGENLSKGRPIIVEGELRSSEWEDKNTGQRRTSIEIHALRSQQLDWADSTPRKPKPEPREIEEPVPEDDVPF